MSRANEPQKSNCFSVGSAHRGVPVAAMCRAALKIVGEAYRAAAKLEYEMTKSPFKKEEKQ